MLLRPRLTLTSFAVAATENFERLVAGHMPPHAHFVRGRGDRLRPPRSTTGCFRLTLTSFAVAATDRRLRHLGLLEPPHAHFVRGRGDGVEPVSFRAAKDRLTLTSFAVAATMTRAEAERIERRLTLTSFAVAATCAASMFANSLSAASRSLRSRSRRLRAAQRNPRLRTRLTLTSFAVAATLFGVPFRWANYPPHAHFVRGRGDRCRRRASARAGPASRSLRSRSRRPATRSPGPTRSSRLTLTSFAVAATARKSGVEGRMEPPHAHFVRGRGDSLRAHRRPRPRAASRSLRSRSRRPEKPDSPELDNARLTLTSFAVAATSLPWRASGAHEPPHAHFVRGRGDAMPESRSLGGRAASRSLRSRSRRRERFDGPCGTPARLTLTSFAVAATAQAAAVPLRAVPPHAHFVRGRGDTKVSDRRPRRFPASRSLRSRSRRPSFVTR